MRFILSLIALLLLSLMCVTAKDSFEEPHALQIVDLYVSSSALSCSKQFQVMVELRNVGSFLETAYVELSSPSLDIDEFSPYITLDDGRTEVLSFQVILPEDPQGQHEFTARVFYNQESKVFFKTFSFSCDQQTLPLFSLPVPSRPSLPVPELVSLSSPVLFTLLLVFSVFLLGITAVFIHRFRQ